MKVYESVLELIGKTPLIHLNKVEESLGLQAHIYAKLESKNPAGSAKDRPAYRMIKDALEKGILNENSTLIEPTSGNTGIALSMIGAYLGLKVKIIMPSNMSVERIKLMQIYGSEVILTDASLGMKGAIQKANELKEEIPNSVILGQFINMSNPLAHYEATGPEIYEALDGKVDAFVSAIGTGGTITGAGTYLKEQNPNIKVFGVEPQNSPILTKGEKGPHLIQGIGAGFIPDILNQNIYDEVLLSSNEEAFANSRLLASKEGLLVGISSGAALTGAIELARRPEMEGKNIVVILPDTGERYLSTKLFE